MLQRLSEAAAAWARRWVPDPFVLAVLLTAVTFAACLACAGGPAGARLSTLLAAWGSKQGLWDPALLAFTVQIMLVLVTGHALASTRPVRAAIDRVADLPRTQGQAAALTALVACATGLLNWGLSLIVGALFARQVGARCRARGLRIHYPLVVAAGYTGLLVWHGGLSGSAPLKVTSAADVKAVVADAEVIAAVGSFVARAVPGAPADGAIPTALTLFRPLNLAVSALLLLVVPALLALMGPRRAEDAREIDDATAKAALASPPPPVDDATPAARLEGSRLLAWGLVLLGVAHLGQRLLSDRPGPLDLDTINLVFFLLGLALHGSLRSYGRAVSEAIEGTAGILVQFPLYFGMVGLMKASGFVAAVSGGLVGAAGGSSALYLALTFLVAGVVSVFVPSGGGQWAVQGSVVLHGAVVVGADPGLAVLALAWGDQWANMLQPFWALPLLGLCGVRAGEIMGYTILLMLLVTPAFVLPLLVAG